MSDKVIVVTGGAGFIGSHYLNLAVPRYPHYTFVNVDALTYAADLGHVRVSSAPNYFFVQADIRDSAAMRALFEQYKPTDIINFAAETHVDNSITGPQVFVDTNVTGTHVLLDLARAYGIERFHHISTDEVYGSLSADAPAVDEEAPLAPRSPYSASKAAADLLVRAYHHTYGLNTVVTRASNNYGPHQHREKLIPRFITALARGERVPLYAQGLNVRDWLYVADHVEGVDRAFHHGQAGEVYNLGGGKELQNIEITKLLLALHGAGEDRIAFVEDRPGHDFRYALNSLKAKRELAWEPETDFTEGLRRTREFYIGELSE